MDVTQKYHEREINTLAGTNEGRRPLVARTMFGSIM